MTFYNVISGILFIGVCQAFVVHFGTGTMWYASLLMVVMFYESVITSHLLEGQHPPVENYTLKMKGYDLLAFILLAYALIVVSPESNQFATGKAIPGAGAPWLFLLLLALYGCVAILWNRAAGRGVESYSWAPPVVLVVVAGLVGVFVKNTALGSKTDAAGNPLVAAPPAWIGLVLTVAMAGYLAFRGSRDLSEERKHGGADQRDRGPLGGAGDATPRTVTGADTAPLRPPPPAPAAGQEAASGAPGPQNKGTAT